MTLSGRNVFFKMGIVFCLLITVLAFGASVLTIPVYPSIEENVRHPANFFQTVSGWFINSSYLAVHASLILAVLFSAVTMILIFSFFERTSAPEILYISLFTISLSFEIIRLILPLHLIYNFSFFYLLNATKILLFARYFSVFSLFAASICAAGLEIQKIRNIILILIVTVLLIVMGIPIDTQTWDAGFNMVRDHPFLLKMIEVVVFIATVLTFFVAVKVRDSKEYAYIGIGVVLALTGRNILIGTDNWAGPVLGILLLSFGVWFICSKLHKIHLWL